MTRTMGRKNGMTVCWMLFWAVLSMSSYSCQTAKPQLLTQVSQENPKGDIVFLSLKMQKDDTGNESIELISTIWSNGILKNKTSGLTEKNMLVCEFLDKDENLVKSVPIAHPLFAGSEYFSPDGTAKRNPQGLREAMFMIRAEVDRSVVYLSINSTSGKRISLLELN